MELLAYYIYGALCLLGSLALGYRWHVWEVSRDSRVQAQVEQRVSEPEPQPGTMARPNYRAVALLDQVDALIHRMDEAEMDEVIDEMQRRGW